MSAVNNATSAVATPFLTPWMPGPVDPGDAPVVVSVTKFSAHHRRVLSRVAANGVRMRVGWYGMSRAGGMWVWGVAAARGRGGGLGGGSAGGPGRLLIL